nr:uncharacterized protein LOC112770507 isoform X4 [Arachis hypogaea]XP_029151019.1 uncharacterized protein LOC112770507 isoform X4 [Arachis hypogaea]
MLATIMYLSEGKVYNLSSMTCERKDIWNTGPPAATRFFTVAIVIMRQRMISGLFRSLDMTFPVIKLNRFSKTALIVEFVWASTFAGYASFLMTMYLRNNTIAAAVEFAELEDLKIASTATSVSRLCGEGNAS